MLHLKNNILSQTKELIDSALYDLELIAEDDVESIFGVLTMGDGCEKIVAFTQLSNKEKYKARLVIAEEDLKYITIVKMKLVLITDGGLHKQTNTINLSADIAKIKQSVKVAISKDIKDLTLKVSGLEKQINTMLKGKVLDGINIKNTEYIRKGMIPVAVDDNGNFVATYPFNDTISKVNGQDPVNGSVDIDAFNIQYKNERTVGDTIGYITTALKALNESVKTLAEQMKAINDNVNQLMIDNEYNKNQGII